MSFDLTHVLICFRSILCLKAAARLLVISASTIACNLNSRLYEWFLDDESSDDESEEEVDDGDDGEDGDDG